MMELRVYGMFFCGLLCLPWLAISLVMFARALRTAPHEKPGQKLG